MHSLALDVAVATPTLRFVPLATGEWTLSDTLAWLAIGTFVLGAALYWAGASVGRRTAGDRRGATGDRRRQLEHLLSTSGQYVTAGAWVVFGIFWLSVVPHFYYEVHSPIQSLLSFVAVPLCLYTGFLLVKGRESLLVLSKAVAFMGLIYLPAETLPFVRQWLVETVALQTHFGMELLGYSPGIVEGPNGYQTKFDFDGYTTYIVVACTGIGSISIFGGLIAAVTAPLGRKLAAFVTAVGIIWILNLARNVFVALASPLGWLQYEPLITITTDYVGEAEASTSYFFAHTVIAQSLSVVALIVITLTVLRILPELVTVLEEVLFVVTGTEYDLAEALGLGPTAARADGGDRVE